MPIDPLLLDAAALLADDLAASNGEGVAGAGARLADHVRDLRTGIGRTALRISLIRTLDTSEPDEEWAERTELARIRVGTEHGSLAAEVNLATMVGASQSSVARATDGDDPSTISSCVERVRLLLADPSHRLLSLDEAPDPERRVTLRDERDGADRRWLGAHLDPDGNLHIDGQDLGPSTAVVSGDGEYEWFQTIPATAIPALLVALEASTQDHVLDVLEERFTGLASYDLEAVLRSGAVPLTRQVWSG